MCLSQVNIARTFAQMAVYTVIYVIYSYSPLHVGRLIIQIKSILIYLASVVYLKVGFKA